jgi:FMN phosphatase YigB (HAD superfamily)
MDVHDHGRSAWLVDVDGTLYRSRPVQLAMACELVVCGLRNLRVIRRFRYEHERLRGDALGLDPYQVQVERTAAALRLSVDHVRSVVEIWMIRRPLKWIRLFRRRRLLAELHHFRSSGGKLGIVSDYPATDKLRALGLSDVVHVVIANGESPSPRALKPAAAGYMKAAQLLGVQPADCMVIGDRWALDGVAAAAAGMRFRLVPGPWRSTSRRAQRSLRAAANSSMGSEE